MKRYGMDQQTWDELGADAEPHWVDRAPDGEGVVWGVVGGLSLWLLCILAILGLA